MGFVQPKYQRFFVDSSYFRAKFSFHYKFDEPNDIIQHLCGDFSRGERHTLLACESHFASEAITVTVR